MGGRHAQLLAGMQEVTEVIVVDAVADRAAAVARDVRGRAMTEEEALDMADAVVVASPAEAHAATVRSAVARGLHVLCEKPLTEELESTAALVWRAEAAQAHVEVGFHRRHDPAFSAGRALVDEDRTGRIHLLRLTAFDPRALFRAAGDWESGSIAPLFMHSSIHDFDLVRWMTGQEVVEVTVEASGPDEVRPVELHGIATAIVTMRLSGGTLAVVEASWLHPGGYDNRAELLAEHVHLSMGFSARTPARLLDENAAVVTHPWSGYLERFDAAYRAELESFLAASRGERPPASSARDGLEAMRVVVAASRAYREHRTVSLDEVAGLNGRGAS